MKKLFGAILALVMFASAAFTSYGDVQYDAFNINEEQAQEFKFKEDDSAVMIYSGIYFREFANGKDIYDIISSDAGEVAYLVSSENLIQIRYKMGNEVLTAPISCLARACLSQLCVMARDTGLLFDYETEVKNTFIFHEMWGMTVYYVTNKGNFVMYKDSIVSEEIYLMPDSVYRECTLTMVDFMKSTEGGTSQGYSYLVDISEYQIYPEPMPDITDIPETDGGDCTECPPSAEMTPTQAPEDTKDGDEIVTDTTIDEPPSSQSADTFAIAVWIVIAALIPTLVLGAVIVIILKKR